MISNQTQRVNVMRVAYIGEKDGQFGFFLEIAANPDAFEANDIVDIFDISPESDIDDMLDRILVKK